MMSNNSFFFITSLLKKKQEQNLCIKNTEQIKVLQLLILKETLKQC